MNKSNDFRLLPITAALLAVFGNAYAQDSGEIHDLVTPSSSVSIGIGAVNNTQDAKRFGQYSGMNKGDPYGLFDLNFVRRDDSTGTWLIVQGRDLGLDTREIGFTHQKQGDWKYSVEYNEMVRHDPYTIHSGMTGVGTANPSINLIARPALPAYWVTANPGLTGSALAGSDIELKIKRTALGISAEKWVSPELQVEASFHTEERKGARMFGRVGIGSSDMSATPVRGSGAANGGWAVLLTPEPINSTTNIFEGKVSFNRDKLALTAGYFGSFFTNDFGSLTPSVPGSLNRGALWNNASGCGGPTSSVGNCIGSSTVAQLASSSVALPPDNQAHQFYLSGNYAFTKDTRSNFKVSYTHATQNESFAGMGLTPAAGAPGSLDGEVNTLLAYWALSSRVTKDFSVNASLRYEDRDDRTPRDIYNTSTGNSKTSGTNPTGAGSAWSLNNTTNWPSASQTRTTAKVEGIYRLPQGYSLALGGDWENKKIPTSFANTAITANQVFFRPEMDEYGVHADVRKALSETVSGSLGLEYKERRGHGDWMTTVSSSGNPTTTINPATTASVLPDMYMDRDRLKFKGSLEWALTENLDVQTIYEHAQDSYKREFITTAANPFTPGAREIAINSATVDASYTLSDNWRFNAYWTASEYRWNVNKSSLAEDTRNRSQTLGLGIKGKVTGRLDVGADLMATWDKTSFTNQCISGSGSGATLCTAGNLPVTAGQTLPGNALPKITYNTERVKIFAKYVLDKSSDLRFDAIYQHFKTDDWQWGYNGIPFLYSDNTTVSQPMNQNALFVGARYIYKF